MREIKFRGKRIGSGIWIYGDLIHQRIWSESINSFIIREYDWGFDNYLECEIDANTIGQFTGLYDKNGTEIYEGDIVKVSTDNFREDTIHFIKYGIDQDYPAFDIEPCLDYAESNSLQYLMVWKDVYTIEIIGNIHDNPELLKEQ